MERQDRKARKDILIFALFAVFAFPLSIVAAYQFTPALARLDDAYIALHSARVTLSGHDPIFGVPALVGATSPAYVALLTGILAAGVSNGDTVLRLANALGIAAFALSVWYLAVVEQLSPVRRVALVVVALGSGAIIPFNLTNGLETGWAIATLTFAIAAARAERVVPVAFAAGLLPFLRPDLAPASAVVWLYAIRGRRRAEQVVALAVAVAVAAPWLVWTRLDTGSWVAQTMRAKQFFYAEGCRPWLEKAWTVVRATGFALSQLFPLCLGLVALGRDRLSRAGLLAVAVSLTAYFIAMPGALEHATLRYATALWTPWLCLGLAIGLSRLSSSVAVGLIVAVCAAQSLMWRHGPDEYSEEIKATAEWIDAHVPVDAIVLVHDAGGISEFGHRRAVDLVGLKTPSSIAAHARWTWPSCVMNRGTAVSAIARESGATYFVGLSGWQESLSQNLTAGGFALTPLRRPANGRLGYTVYLMEPSDHIRDR